MPAALRRTATAQRRCLERLRLAERLCARQNYSTAMQARRARTRRLIELGGLVVKSQVPDLIIHREPDLPATLLGALLELADELENHRTAPARVARWRDRGRAAFRDTAQSEGK